MEIMVFAIVAISEAASLYCLLNLWKGEDKALLKIVWTFILFIPLVGPIFYGGMHSPPPVQDDVLKVPSVEWEDLHVHEHVGQVGDHEGE